jgi:hypothetical protein
VDLRCRSDRNGGRCLSIRAWSVRGWNGVNIDSRHSSSDYGWSDSESTSRGTDVSGCVDLARNRSLLRLDASVWTDDSGRSLNDGGDASYSMSSWSQGRCSRSRYCRSRSKSNCVGGDGVGAWSRKNIHHRRGNHCRH